MDEMFRTIELFRGMWSGKELSSVASPKDPEGLHVLYAPHDGEASVEYVNSLQRLVTEQ